MSNESLYHFKFIDEPSECGDVNFDEDAMPIRGKETEFRHRDAVMNSIGSSNVLLSPSQREGQTNRASSLHSSDLASVKRSSKKGMTIRIWEQIKTILSKLKLLIIIIIYSIFGAHLFMWLEVPTDLAEKQDAYLTRLVARQNLFISLNLIHYEDSESRHDKWKSAILQFEDESGLGEPEVETSWTFWMSFLYAGTIYTTIGYGNIACKTTAGRWATMVYAIFGIPIMILILGDLGSFLLTWVKRISSFGEDVWLFINGNCRCRKLFDDKQKQRRYLDWTRRFPFLGVRTPSCSSLHSEKHEAIIEDGVVDGDDDDGLHSDHSDAPPRPDPPVFSTFIATVAWILLSAAVFCLWEDWDFFTSVYFFVISLTTIGLGDVTPAHPEYMIATFGVVLVGLAMVTVFIDVVKEKIELLYMALLEKQLELYMERVDAGDTTAAMQMMEELQAKSKYLNALMSKSSGNKVMEQFKKDAREKGIEIPAVLTDIDPETGLPAFASGNKEDFKELIAQAEERREKEEDKEKLIQERIEARRTGRTPRGSEFNLAPIVETVAVEVQTSVDDFSFGAQAALSTSDFECQTEVKERSDEIVQAYPSLMDIHTQIESADQLLLGDISERSTAIQASPTVVTTATQPQIDSSLVEEFSVGSQFAPSTSEEECQTEFTEKVEKLNPKGSMSEEEKSKFVRRHVELFEKQDQTIHNVDKKVMKKEVDVKEGTAGKLKERFNRTDSTSSSFDSPSTRRKRNESTSSSVKSSEKSSAIDTEEMSRKGK